VDEITPPFRSPFIGVATQHALGSPELKRWLLLFDEIVVDELDSAIRIASDADYKTAELEWLAGQGLLRQRRFDELPPLKDQALQRVIDEANGYYAKRLTRWISLSKPNYDFLGASMSEEASGSRQPGLLEDVSDPREEMRKAESKRMLLRAMSQEGSGFDRVKAQSAALRLRASGVDAVPLHADPTFERKDHLTDVLSILVPSMPIPEQDTPWEKIIDFRSDQQSRDKFVRFRRWATELSTQPEEIGKLDEKLKWMIYDYAKHMEFYKMKTRQSLFEVLVSTSADLVLSLPKVLMGLAKPGFALKKREYELMEADLHAPGKEIAYLYDARQSFH
jgi:hypothetical protein